MFNSIDSLIKHTSYQYASLPAFSLKIGFRTRTYTFKEMYVYIRQFPKLFKFHGISKGDKIIVLSLNRPEYAVLILGCFWSGVTIVPIDYRTNEETVKKFIDKTHPKAIFTTMSLENLFYNTHRKKIFLEDLFTELASFGESDAVEVEKDHTAAILFTSGTTGEPKGTIISNKNITASLNNVREGFPLPSGLRILSVLPLSHALEMFGGMMTAYSFGCHIHYIERINSITIMQAFRRYRIQLMAVVPQMLRLILQNIERKVAEEKKEKDWKKAHRLARHLPFALRRRLFKKVHDALGGEFQMFVCGSAPLEPKVAFAWEEMGVHIYEGYGASETTGFISANNFTGNKIGTVGKLLPRIQTRIAQDGNLWVKGDNIVSGYFGNKERTNAAFKDGWFNTGDIVTIDPEEFLKITGRDKFKIVLPDGKKVYPEDIEKKLNNHPDVSDSVVFGLKTDEGEVVHAELILKNYRTSLTKIIQEVNKTLNPHEQILDSALYPDKDFPRTKTLKIDREAVRQAAMHKISHTEERKTQMAHNTDPLIKILKTVSGRGDVNMHSNTTLASDLKLDSLKRIELLALIEEELGITVAEVEITPQITVADLRELIKKGKPVAADDQFQLSSRQFSSTMENLRVFWQDALAFPVFNQIAKLTIVHPENIEKIKTPQLFIFNHVGVYDVLQDIRVLPRELRKKTAVAANAEFWKLPAYQRIPMITFGNTFPFVRSEDGNNAMKGNFERVGQLLDMGYNIFISPEANITHTGELLPFHTGAGYIVVEMGVPVTLFKLKGYFDIWPEDKKRKLNLFWPKKFGKAEVIVSDPISFEPGTPYEVATRILHQKMLDLK